MKYFFLYLFILCAVMQCYSLTAYSSEVITDPVQHCMELVNGADEFTQLQFYSYPPTTLMKITADVDGDGKLEILLSAERYNGREGSIWNVYTPVSGGYEYVGLIAFPIDAFYIGDFGEYGRGIVKYFRSSATTGMLIIANLKNRRIRETAIRELHDNPEDDAFFDGIFGRDDQPVVESIPLSELGKPEINDKPDDIEPKDTEASIKSQDENTLISINKSTQKETEDNVANVVLEPNEKQSNIPDETSALLGNEISKPEHKEKDSNLGPLIVGIVVLIIFFLITMLILQFIHKCKNTKHEAPKR